MKHFADYQLSKLAKECGIECTDMTVIPDYYFDEDGNACYWEDIDCRQAIPQYHLYDVQLFLRDMYNINISIRRDISDDYRAIVTGTDKDVKIKFFKEYDDCLRDACYQLMMIVYNSKF